MNARHLFVILSFIASTSGAYAQTTGGGVPPVAPEKPYQSPLQRNFDAAKTVPAKVPGEVDRRCREIAASYFEGALSGQRDQTAALQDYNQRKSLDQASGKWDDYRRNTEQMNTLQGDYSAGNAAKAYRDSGCR